MWVLKQECREDVSTGFTFTVRKSTVLLVSDTGSFSRWNLQNAAPGASRLVSLGIFESASLPCVFVSRLEGIREKHTGKSHRVDFFFTKITSQTSPDGKHAVVLQVQPFWPLISGLTVSLLNCCQFNIEGETSICSSWVLKCCPSCPVRRGLTVVFASEADRQVGPPRGGGCRGWGQPC